MSELLSERQQRFVAKPRVAVLATVGRHGAPHTAPVWYRYQDGVFIVLTDRGSQKHRNVERDPRVELCIDDKEPPYHTVIVREAVRAAHDQNGALIVAASGNSGQEGVSYPARYPGVLAVGAASIANPDKRAKFSSTGPQVSVVAVGENIVGTVPQSSCGGGFLPCVGGPYATGSGTSFAAPQVSGLVALILSRSRGLKPDAIIATIEEAATAVPAGDRPNWAGAGRINMAESLRPAYQLGAPGLTRN